MPWKNCSFSASTHDAGKGQSDPHADDEEDEEDDDDEEGNEEQKQDIYGDCDLNNDNIIGDNVVDENNCKFQFDVTGGVCERSKVTSG